MFPIKNKSQLVVHVQRQITDELRNLIVGEIIPGEVELASKCSVSRTTVRRALYLMEKEGLIRTEENGRRCLLRKARKSETAKTLREPLSRDRCVVRYVLDKIGSGAILPGDRISESKIAAELGFSTGPVREGLLHLAPLALLKKRARRQWEAISFTAKQWEYLTEMRMLVEEYCLKKLLQGELSEKHRKFLEEHLQLTKEFINPEREDLGELLELDKTFHQWLIDSANNPMLLERNQFIYLLIEFQMRNSHYSMDRARVGLDQHITIIRAIIRGDTRDAILALRDHINSSLKTLELIVRQESAAND